MNTSVLIFLSVLLGLPAVYALMRWIRVTRRNNKQRMLAESYEQLILSNRLVVRLYDIIGDAVIALDAENRKLAVVDLRGKRPVQQCILLRCINETQVVRDEDQSGETAGVYLSLKDENNDRLHKICFFDRRTDDIKEADQMMVRAQEWRLRILNLQQQPRIVSERIEKVRDRAE